MLQNLESQTSDGHNYKKIGRFIKSPSQTVLSIRYDLRAADVKKYVTPPNIMWTLFFTSRHFPKMKSSLGEFSASMELSTYRLLQIFSHFLETNTLLFMVYDQQGSLITKLSFNEKKTTSFPSWNNQLNARNKEKTTCSETNFEEFSTNIMKGKKFSLNWEYTNL